MARTPAKVVVMYGVFREVVDGMHVAEAAGVDDEYPVTVTIVESLGTYSPFIDGKACGPACKTFKEAVSTLRKATREDGLSLRPSFEDGTNARLTQPHMREFGASASPRNVDWRRHARQALAASLMMLALVGAGAAGWWVWTNTQAGERVASIFATSHDGRALSSPVRTVEEGASPVRTVPDAASPVRTVPDAGRAAGMSAPALPFRDVTPK